MNKIKDFINKIKDNKKIRYVIVFVLVGAILILFLINKTTNSKTGAQTSYNYNTVEGYVAGLENKLVNTLSKIEGAGDVSVVITVESGMETVLASKITVNETSNGKETVETPILVNGKTVVIKELYPKIIGVLIVAKGAGNIAVMRKLQQAAVSLLDVNVNRIEILSMK